MTTREEWARALLRLLDCPERPRNLTALVAWQAAEGGPSHSQAKWNPLNSTQTMPGATDFNTVGVKNYVSEDQGLEATVKTLHGKGHGYEPILERLAKNSRPRTTLSAVEASDWGTGGLARSIVDDVKAHWEAYANVEIGQ